MVRTVNSHQNEEEEEEEEYQDFASRTPDDSSHKVKDEGRSGDQKLRSKHSETEQRRRSKINERFQILRDLIPENDQKRDKASFLLEVIQYIQFLQEKLQIYEGSYAGWSPEPSKLTPWKSNSVPVESFVEQPPFVRSDCNQEDNLAVTQRLLTNSHNSVESDLSAPTVYKMTDHHHPSTDQATPLNIPLQPNVFASMSAPHQVSDVEHLAAQSKPQYLSGKWSPECNIPGYTPNEQEDLRSDSGEADFSNAYSQRLLNTLTHALQSSGVDLSRASISVQLDVGKHTSAGTMTSTCSTKDCQNQTGVQPISQYLSCGESYDHVNKRLRTGES